MRYFYFFILLFCFNLNDILAAEDYSWWNTIHHWDGQTSWVQYMTISSSFMGPNALPVPELKKGMITGEAEIEQMAGAHFSHGDKTQDFFSRVYIPIGNNKAALEMYVVPLEFYKMDSITRDTRAARTKSGKGYAGGDIYFSTQIQLLKDHQSLPDMMLELACRTASGTNLGNARYTDSPGYFFNLSFGKNYSTGGKVISTIRPCLMGGFYSYQTYDLQHPQNDALLYSAGLDLTLKKLLLSQQISGYSGYLHNGDKPMVYRFSLRWERRRLDWKLWYQWGVRDFAYQTLRLGLIYHFALTGK